MSGELRSGGLLQARSATAFPGHRQRKNSGQGVAAAFRSRIPTAKPRPQVTVSRRSPLLPMNDIWNELRLAIAAVSRKNGLSLVLVEGISDESLLQDWLSEKEDPRRSLRALAAIAAVLSQRAGADGRTVGLRELDAALGIQRSKWCRVPRSPFDLRRFIDAYRCIRCKELKMPACLEKCVECHHVVCLDCSRRSSDDAPQLHTMSRSATTGRCPDPGCGEPCQPLAEERDLVMSLFHLNTRMEATRLIHRLQQALTAETASLDLLPCFTHLDQSVLAQAAPEALQRAIPLAVMAAAQEWTCSCLSWTDESIQGAHEKQRTLKSFPRFAVRLDHLLVAAQQTSSNGAMNEQLQNIYFCTTAAAYEQLAQSVFAEQPSDYASKVLRPSLAEFLQRMIPLHQLLVAERTTVGIEEVDGFQQDPALVDAFGDVVAEVQTSLLATLTDFTDRVCHQLIADAEHNDGDGQESDVATLVALLLCFRKACETLTREISRMSVDGIPKSLEAGWNPTLLVDGLHVIEAEELVAEKGSPSKIIHVVCDRLALENLKGALWCPVCREMQDDVFVCVNGGHLACCQGCAAFLGRCPVCRATRLPARPYRLRSSFSGVFEILDGILDFLTER